MAENRSPETGKRAALLAAALPHVTFDGWGEATFRAAAEETGIGLAVARVICPRGALDLACDYHRQGDRRMAERLATEELSALRFRDRVALAIRLRLSLAEREVVRRGAALFALPQNAAVGAGLVWGTADAIWRALGDTSSDLNWYTKRATLAAVWSAVVLYWLGDESDGQAASWDFLDRRIGEVMRIEKAKAGFRASPLAGILAGPLSLLGAVRAPAPPPDDLPGKSG
jgi:ubiquinone biosynthesis protein COQ9